MDFQGMLDLVLGWLAWVWADPFVKVVLAHVVINTVLAAMVTLWTGEFVLARVPEFLWKKILPLVGTYLVFDLFGEAAGWGGISVAVWAMLEVTLIGDALDNLKKLGIEIGRSNVLAQIPEALTKERTKEKEG